MASTTGHQSPPASPEKDSGIRITLFGGAINLALLGAKIVVGLLTGSIALIADGVHSGSDLVTDLLVLIGIRLGARKADETHPYGHGRFETLAGGGVALALLAVGFLVAYKAGKALYEHEHNIPGTAVLVVAAASILAKEWLYRVTVRLARRVGSAALEANAWHHRSDAFSSVAVLAGAIAGLADFGHADQAAGMVVGLMVGASGGRTLFDVFHEITEGSLCRAEMDAIREAVGAVSGVRDSHQLRTRRVGREIFVDLHVIVGQEHTLLESHYISMEVEEAVKAACKRPVNVVVHMEPDAPELAEHQEHAG